MATKYELREELEQLAAERARLRGELQLATDTLAAFVRLYVRDRVFSETEVAKVTGIARNTIRAWLGKK